MKPIKRILRTLLRTLKTTHTVTVRWEGREYVHPATSLSDALSWFRCYPVGSRAVIHRNLTGQILAMRG